MNKIKINDKVLRLKNNYTLKLPNQKLEFDFKGGQEFHIVSDVVYMSGYPVPIELQHIMMNWIMQNPNLFVDDTRIW